MKTTFLDSRPLLLVYFLLPIVTYLDVTERNIPSAIFVGYWFLSSGVLGLLITSRIAGISKSSANPLIALFCVVLSASIVVPLSVPSNVLDNFPSTPQTVNLTQSTLDLGRLPKFTPQPGGETISYVNYPSAIFTLASANALTGLSFTILAKALGLLLSVIPMFAFYALIKNKVVALPAATLAGLSPWIFTTLTHYTPAALASVLLCFNIAMLFRLFEDGTARNLVVAVALSVALTFSDPLMSFLWTVFLVGFLPVKYLFREKDDSFQIRAISTLTVVSIGLWLAWYVLLSGSNAMMQYLTLVAGHLLSASKLTTTALQPTGNKPSLLAAVEYLSFLAIIIFSLAVPLFFRRRNTFYSAMVAGSLLAAFATVLPWIAGFALATDLISRSSFIFQVGVASVIAVFLFQELKTPGRWKVLACVVLITLASSNALLYGVDPGRYNPSSPMLSDDSRMNLEAWYLLGVTLCHQNSTDAVWGVRIGVPFATCLHYYNEFVPGATATGAIVPASDLLNLRSSIGPAQYVVLRESMGLIPEWAQLPASPSAIFQIYDVIFRSGDAVLLYTGNQ